jgi:predicted Zn-dependent protease
MTTGNFVRPLQRPGAFAVLFVLIPLAGALTGCANDRSVIAQAQQTHTQLEPAVIKDPELSSYLQQVGERIIAAAKEADANHVGPKAHFKDNDAWMFSKNMQFHLVNSKTLNAFTTGGEHMYIYNELFQKCKTEDELAAVMSHEYAHVYSRHVAQGTNRQMPLLIGGALAGAGTGYAIGGENRGETAAAGAAVGAGVGQFANMGFTRGDEAQADKYGFYFYTHAGWDPQKFADFFKAMITMGYDKTPGWLSDHPTLASRVEEAEKRVKQLPPEASQWRRPPIASPDRFHQLQQRAQQIAARTPDDKAIAGSQALLRALPRSCVAPLTEGDAEQTRQELMHAAKQKQ